jgi:hypothetical protein
MTQPLRGASRRTARRRSTDDPIAVDGGTGENPALEQPVAVPGLALPGAATLLRTAVGPEQASGGLLAAMRQHSSSCRHADPAAGSEPAGGLTVRRSPDQVIRRAPVPGPTEGEFVDAAAPGMVFVPTGRPNEYLIKGSDIRVSWDAESDHWLNADGIVVEFGTPGPTAGPTPSLDLTGGLPLPAVSTLPPKTKPGKKGGVVPNPEWTHYPLTMQDFKRLGVYDQMLKLAELASSFPITPYELSLRANNPSERPTKFYRYHKFPVGFDDPQYVLGGGLNKVEITEEWQSKALKKLIADRQKLLMSLQVSPQKTVKAMEQFQANAMTTPFIATTVDREYAESLYREYPPTPGQRAVVLVIEGPKANAFDFEEMYQTIKGTGGGRAEWNWRTSADRAKDADQAEFGLPDLFIPLRGVSPLGFRVVEVVELGVPTSSQAALLSQDQRMQVIRARGLPKNSELEARENHGH